MCEVEGAKSIDDLKASASFTRGPTPDFENLDFQIGSGLRKILTGNFNKTNHHSPRNTSIREEITYRQTDCLDDLRRLQNSWATMETILDLRDWSKDQFKNDNVQAFDTKWDEVSPAITERPTDSMFGESAQDAS